MTRRVMVQQLFKRRHKVEDSAPLVVTDDIRLNRFADQFNLYVNGLRDGQINYGAWKQMWLEIESLKRG